MEKRSINEEIDTSWKNRTTSGWNKKENNGYKNHGIYYLVTVETTVFRKKDTKEDCQNTKITNTNRETK